LSKTNLSHTTQVSEITANLSSWIIRVAGIQEPLSLRLTDRNRTEITTSQAFDTDPCGICQLFGSARVRMLEQIRVGFYKDAKLKEILNGMGYNSKLKKDSLYPENIEFSGLFLDEILVYESLFYGIPSALRHLYVPVSGQRCR